MPSLRAFIIILHSWLDQSHHFVAKAIEELDGSPRSVAHAFLCRRRLTVTIYVSYVYAITYFSPNLYIYAGRSNK
jgi:hypothetical protein